MSILIPDGSELVAPQTLAEYTSGVKGGNKHQAIVICDASGNERTTFPIEATGGADIYSTAKGSQGTLGLATQDLKDAGRQQVCLYWENLTPGVGESALTNWLIATRGGINLGAANFYTVSTGKTLRITCINASLHIGGTTPAIIQTRLRIRQADSAIANTSAIIWAGVLEMDTSTASAGKMMSFPIPEGLEIPATKQITFTHNSTNTGGTSTPGLCLAVIGYEY